MSLTRAYLHKPRIHYITKLVITTIRILQQKWNLESLFALAIFRYTEAPSVYTKLRTTDSDKLPPNRGEPCLYLRLVKVYLRVPHNSQDKQLLLAQTPLKYRLCNRDTAHFL